ncbi:hypothetical protein TELCIR_06219 [Teladorsagia circumcincta]|uniref:Acyltransferase C-terminal domain-containing protein n=1 Tax=Teladorsagia circumcincta TaxID=45464 RepID=A0A2G9UQ60_TELCI|nr:hypothetical protein TELCIR_06219 [Teladorsagia circumcincta]
MAYHLDRRAAGWAMGCNSYVFLNRRFETDQSRLEKILNYFARCGFNYQILLYPEGTDKCPLATERSRKYAEKNGLVHYEYVLHPRTTGFVHIVQCMRKAGYIDYIYDVTIGFGDCIVQSELDFAVNGICSKDVHYQEEYRDKVRKLKISELPLGDKELAKWLIDLWREKEEKLRHFYSKSADSREFEMTPEGQDYEMTKGVYVTQLCIIAFWTLTTLTWLYGFLMQGDGYEALQSRVTSLPHISSDGVHHQKYPLDHENFGNKE